MLTPDEIRQATGLVIKLLERFEGLYLRPYLCPAGVPTLGLGTTRYPDGRRVRLSDPPITREHAYVIAAHQIQADYLPAAIAACSGVETAGQLAAVVDFAYNLGSAALRGSTLRKRINAGDWPGARREFARWNKGGGRVLRGLVIRRGAEVALT